jgi:hypothetical protein
MQLQWKVLPVCINKTSCSLFSLPGIQDPKLFSNNKVLVIRNGIVKADNSKFVERTDAFLRC